MWVVLAFAAIGAFATTAVVLRTEPGDHENLPLVAFLGLLAAAGIAGGLFVPTENRWYGALVVTALVAAALTVGAAFAAASEPTWCTEGLEPPPPPGADCNTAAVPAAFFMAPFAYLAALPGVLLGRLLLVGASRARRPLSG